MTKTKKKIIKITVISIVSLVLVCAICYVILLNIALSRHYEEDLTYSLTGDRGVLIIRRWYWLAVGGDEVHYKRDWKSATVYLGEIVYRESFSVPEVREVDEDTVCVSWGADRSETYDLPKDVPLSPWLWVGIGGGAAVVIGGAVAALIVRKKRRRAVAVSEEVA